ncbi:30S ribosomal protein S17 [Schlesneria sp. DSM 10557]|uniref:30S ribosomal protein S17 n=1 Tax=Schlesneria sp. DSM 10557 TaxID=3044399 RepID=UPI00359FE93D
MRRRLVGVVASDRCDKTRRVEVRRVYRHAKYQKTVTGTTVCHAHDEGNVSKVGDVVEIIESRPMSRLKRWCVVSVVTSARKADSAIPYNDAPATESAQS